MNIRYIYEKLVYIYETFLNSKYLINIKVCIQNIQKYIEYEIWIYIWFQKYIATLDIRYIYKK